MKFSLHNRMSASYLKKADEIIVAFRDRKALPDYFEKYPDASVVLEVTPETQWEMAEIKDYFILGQGHFVLCLPDMTDPRIGELREAGIPFFWGYTITTFYELAAVIAAGASQARIGAPIFFDTERLKKFDIEKRATANIAHPGYIPTMDGIVGTWIRPEDVKLYEDIFTTLEFADCDNSKEEALYRIYAEQHKWPGRVDMIISNIYTDAYNRMLPKDFTQHRLTCGQRCVSGGACQLCSRYLKLANPDLIRSYAESQGLI